MQKDRKKDQKKIEIEKSAEIILETFKQLFNRRWLWKVEFGSRL